MTKLYALHHRTMIFTADFTMQQYFDNKYFIQMLLYGKTFALIMLLLDCSINISLIQNIGHLWKTIWKPYQCIIFYQSLLKTTVISIV